MAASLDLVTVGATWVLFLLALSFLEPQGSGLESVVGGGLIGAVLVGVGFFAASRYRPLPERSLARRAQLAVGALLVGVGVGVMNLGANVAMAAADPGIQALLREHFVPLPWTRVASVAIVEEVAFRLFLMGVVAWGVSRLTSRPRTVFLSALIVSALLFGPVHMLGRPLPAEPSVAALYASGVILKSGLAGLVLGWVFWRGGLPYAILCHFAANGLHKVFEPILFT